MSMGKGVNAICGLGRRSYLVARSAPSIFETKKSYLYSLFPFNYKAFKSLFVRVNKYD